MSVQKTNGGVDGLSETETSTTTTRYLIVRPENGGFGDLFRFFAGPTNAAAKFLDTAAVLGGGGEDSTDRRWVIFVSIVVIKIIHFFGKPMEVFGWCFEFILNLLSNNGNFLALLYNLLSGKVVMPQRGTENFISAIGHLDGRINLYKFEPTAEGGYSSESPFTGRGLAVEPGNRALLDLCMMASKLAYENAIIVKNVVNQHWKMHFIDFYNCWNDYQKEMSTQVFILSDKPKDANLILISFRGTEPFDAGDWITDFDYSWYEIPKLGKVHMGFLEALGLGSRVDTSTFASTLQTQNTKSTYSNGSVSSPTKLDSENRNSAEKLIPEMVEMTAYFAVKSKLKSLLKEHKNAKFVVTGHSLGGALAILFPTVLVLHEERDLMKRLSGVYTYGQPRVGNRQLGQYMEAQLNHSGPRYFRVVYCNDLVPRLPYDDKTFLYKHFGECLYYNSLYIDQKVDEEPNRNYYELLYLIPDHINAIWELIRSLISGYMYGPEYSEGWLSVCLRTAGLVCPGISAHSPTNYVNSIRLGKDKTLQMHNL